MKAYFANISTTTWVLLAVPALVATRCVVATVPLILHAIVPEVVRTVLRVI